MLLISYYIGNGREHRNFTPDILYIRYVRLGNLDMLARRRTYKIMGWSHYFYRGF